MLYYIRLLQKGSTVNLKDFHIGSGKVEGLIRFDDHFKLVFEPKKKAVKSIPDKLNCPKCKTGTIVKGNAAYGCSHYKEGCDFRMSFDDVRRKMNGQQATKDLVFKILNGTI